MTTTERTRGRRLALVAMIVALTTLLAACGGASEQADEAASDAAAGGDAGGADAGEPDSGGTERTSPAEAAGGDVCQGQDGSGLKVGFANLGESVPFAVSVREGIEEIAAQCNLQIVNADNQLDPQIAQDNARNFVAQGVDGVIEFQVNGDISSSICEILGGVPVIAIDIAHDECAVFMGANNRTAGELGGAGAGALAEEMWACEIDRVVTFEAFGVGQVNIDRLNGAIAGLQGVCPDNEFGDFEEWAPDVPDSIITRLDADRLDPAFEQGRDWLTANADAERIVALCINDDSCLGMVAAVGEAGRDGQVIFASQGADPSIWDEIRQNEFYAGSTAYFPERYGELLVPNIIRMINGEDPQADPLLIEHTFISADTIDEHYPAS